MPSENHKILKFNQNQKSDKTSFVIYADRECLIKNIDGLKNNPENVSTTTIGKHVPSGCFLSTISSFKSMENNHDVYRGKERMKKFFESLREHTVEIINFKKKKLLTKEQ